MSIVQATPDDLSQIKIMLSSCIAKMHREGIYIWDENYPSQETLMKDILHGCLFLFKYQQQVVGMIVLDEKQDEKYTTINWQYKSPVFIIHRLCVSGEQQSKGIASRLMDFAEQKAAKENYHSIRLDVYHKSEQAIRFYEKRAYQVRGAIVLDYIGESFFCYEKLIK